MVRPARAIEIVLAIVLTIAGLYAFASTGQSMDKAISLSKAWARPTIGTIANGAAYLQITNSGDKADRLIGVSGGVAKRIELHEHIHEGTVMRMRKVEGGVAIDPGQTKTFSPGGHHIMLIGVTTPLKEGDRVPLTLKFEKAGELTVEVSVQRRAP